MTASLWRSRPDYQANADDPSGRFRARRLRSARASVESLEGRQLLTATLDPIKLADVGPALTGSLDPASDSGISNSDAVTNVTRPVFSGSASPGSLIQLIAVPVGTNISVPIGQTVANASGAWNLTSIALADGRYDIEAIGSNEANDVPSFDLILPNKTQGNLVIDTVAPKVANVQFEPLTGRVQVAFDGGTSGLVQGEVTNTANYQFIQVAPPTGKAHPNRAGLPLSPAFVTSGASTAPEISPAAPQLVTVSIDNNQPLRAGFYRFTIKSGGIEDRAGNALDGEFNGVFPSGNNQPGGDFVANLASLRNTVQPPSPISSTSSPVTPTSVKPTSVFIPTTRPVRVGYTSATPGHFMLAGGNNIKLYAFPGQNYPGTFHPKPTKHRG